MFLKYIPNILSLSGPRVIKLHIMANVTRSKSKISNDSNASDKKLELNFALERTKSRMRVANKREIDVDVKVKIEDESLDLLSNIKQEPQSPIKKPRKHIKVEYDTKVVMELKQEPQSSKVDIEKSDWRPLHWEEMLSNIRQMRSTEVAPVDNMGCHMCHDEAAPPHIIRYQNLVALMLSSQTKDQVTFAAMQRLKSHGLTIENILNTSDDVLGKLIYPVGFWKSKVKYIKKTTQTLKDEYNSDIPGTVEELCRLTGVGPKMAHICMSVAWNKVTGIGVDTHVHRISNRIGWLPKVTKTPEATRVSLQNWLPYELWSEVNHLLVGFGQTICTPVKPHCESCLNNKICPYGSKQIK